jgi:hypothetical protein
MRATIEDIQMIVFTKLFEETLQKSVETLREFCYSGEKIEFLITALVAGDDIPCGNMTTREDFLKNLHRQYVLSLAVH